MTQTTQEFSRYRQVVASLAGPWLSEWSTAAATWDVSLGVAAARLLLQDDPAQHALLSVSIGRLAQPPLDAAPLLDPAGHSRPIYLPLVIHLNLAAFYRRFENLSPSVWAYCEQALPAMVERTRACEQFANDPPPPALFDVVLWQALCIAEFGLAVGRDADLEYVDTIVHQVVSRPGEGGALHARRDGESLDAWTYRELAGLHALANLALLRRHRAWSARVEQIALYHLENTQPDNVTTQPWGVFAFLWSPQTRSFAEQQLHDVSAHMGNERGVAALLLADAAACLDAFVQRP